MISYKFLVNVGMWAGPKKLYTFSTARHIVNVYNFFELRSEVLEKELNINEKLNQ